MKESANDGLLTQCMHGEKVLDISIPLLEIMLVSSDTYLIEKL